MKALQLAILVAIATRAAATPSVEVVCSYAPSQSRAVAALSVTAGGVSALTAPIATATGLTAVAHSSGALILTGTSGYVAGTLGTGAAAFAAAPFVVAVGLVVGGSAVTVELVCAARNHPDQVRNVNRAATEFSRRFNEAMKDARRATGNALAIISPAAGRAAVTVKQVATDVWQYVYRMDGGVASKPSR